MKTRLLSAAALSLVLLASAGCAPPAASNNAAPVTQPATSTAVPEPPLPLELVETGFVIDKGPNYYVDYGFVLKNPNARTGAVSPTVRITMRDASGGVLGTEDLVLKRIMPGASVAGGGEDLDPHLKKPKKVDFEVLDPGANWRTAEQMGSVGFKPLTVTGVKASTSGIMTSFTGQTSNPNASAFDEVTVSVVMRDKSGGIVYVLTGPVGLGPADGRLPANATVPFRVDVVDPPANVTFDAYTQP